MRLVRLIPCLLIPTLLYATFAVLDIVPPPSWLYDRVAPATQLVHHTLRSPLLSYQSNSIHSEYMSHFATSTSAFTRSLPWINPKGLWQMFVSNAHRTSIGGAWLESPLKLHGLNTTLPNTVVFLPEASQYSAIPTYSSNGFINSRIDLRRRKRAFDERSVGSLLEAPILLHLRDDAAFPSADIDSAVFITQLHDAITRNRAIKKEKSTRRPRKANKKGGRTKSA